MFQSLQGSPAGSAESRSGAPVAPESSTRGTRVAAAAILIHGLLLVLAPSGSMLLLIVDNVGATLASLVAGALCLAAGRRHTVARSRLSWQLFGLALVSWALGDAYWAWSELVWGITPSVPSWADAGYVGMALLVIAGAALHPTVRSQEISRLRLFLDATMFLSALIAVSWAVVLGPLYEQFGTEPSVQLVTLLYPLGSLSALFLLTILMLRSAEASRASRLLAAGLTLIAGADVVYVVLAAENSYTTGHITDWFWFSGAVLMGLAALEDVPSPAPAARGRVVGQPWQFLPPTGLLILASVVVWLAGHGQQSDAPIAAEAALGVAGILLIVRMAIGYRDAALVHRLHVERAEQVEAARVAREEAARLQGVILTSRELSHVLGNDLAIAVAGIELLRGHPSIPDDLLAIVEDASNGLDRATTHLRRLQQVERIATHETPAGQALDLDRSAP